ncbi:Signal transduction histidine kinase [Pseudoxanthomonas sp. GM95]|uniref:hybrid sensor histidine kinase/response regulator n=1 Tax=Pseudoxanthomonas sp. GM95 TaxID=1881043 RepID=UPI0008BA1B1E|nr:ATP-binding protein [Pseudoxanthomonas sp. GM95]SEL75361.1 Signal transduction histidine kinase [Pseudoxanthomonas sp. GM95]
MQDTSPGALAPAAPSLDALRPNGALYQADATPADQRRAPDDPELRQLLGLDGHDTADWWRAVRPDDLAGARSEYAQLVADGTPMDSEYRIRLPDGGERWLRDRARVCTRDAQGKPSALLGVIDDVTHRNTLRQRAQEAANKYRLLFDSINSGFCVIELLFDADGQASDYRFLEINTAFAQVTGIHDGIGRRMREIAPDHEQHWFDTYGRIARTRVAERFENGAAELGFYYDVYAFPLGDAALNQVGILFTDITQRKLAEDALRADGRRKTEFIAMLAHELRNPLATITSGMQAIKLGSHGMAMHPATPMMERQIGQMTQLLDDLLDLNRINLGKVTLRPERTNLAQLVAQAAEAFQPYYLEQRLTLACVTPAHAVWAQVDAVRITQALGNLLSNAAKFSDADGHVRLELHQDGDQASISVRDEGIGIEPAQLDHIFELFAQVDSDRHASFGGLGVGVALARELVDLHGGQIGADSAGIGQGSTFSITLPIEHHAAPAPASKSAGDMPQAATTGHSILVIDDNVDAADSISMVLELLGHRINTRYSGPDGLQAVHDDRPDVVFSDIGMPGMDGHEVCRQLRALPGGEAIRIIALTGWGAQEDREQTAEAGFDFHLVKPVTTAKLREALAAVFS